MWIRVNEILAMLRKHLADMDHASFMFGELPGQQETRDVIDYVVGVATRQMLRNEPVVKGVDYR
jgi:hypothetical protein